MMMPETVVGIRLKPNLPLKDSMNALSVGLPGRLNSSVTPRVKAHRSNNGEGRAGLAAAIQARIQTIIGH